MNHAPEGAPGLWSIVGGKLTTHRTLAEQTVDRALAWLRRGRHRPAGAAALETLDLPALRRSAAEAAAGLPLEAAQVEYLVTLYGARAGEVLERARRDPALAARICPGNPDTGAQVEIAVEREWAVTLADLLLRRTGIGTSPCLGLDCAERAAHLMARAAGWSEARRAAEVAAYRQLIQQRYRAGLNGD